MRRIAGDRPQDSTGSVARGQGRRAARAGVETDYVVFMHGQPGPTQALYATDEHENQHDRQMNPRAVTAAYPALSPRRFRVKGCGRSTAYPVVEMQRAQAAETSSALGEWVGDRRWSDRSALGGIDQVIRQVGQGKPLHLRKGVRSI